MCIFEMYKIAIEGRNNHYKNYNEWVNLYSIFTGALFIGYYTSADKQSLILPTMIALAGMVSSLCWYLSVMGYYSWILSWIKIVHEYEEELNYCYLFCYKKCPYVNYGIRGKKYYVYDVFYNVKNNYEHVSTQKVTRLFTSFLCFMWNVLFFISLFSLSKYFKKVCHLSNAFIDLSLILMGLFLIVAELWFVLVFRKEKLLSSIEFMKRSIYG